MSKSVLAAQTAVADLGRELEVAKENTRIAREACAVYSRELRDLQRRRFGPMAHSMLRFTETSISDCPSMRAVKLGLGQPHAFQLIDQYELLASHQPLEVIQKNIDKVVEMFADGVRQQLRTQAWPLLHSTLESRYRY